MSNPVFNLKDIRAKQFQLALFDLDGTLIDSVPDLAMSVDFALANAGLEKPGENKVRQWVGNGAPLLVKRAIAHITNCTVEGIEGGVFDSIYRDFQNYYADNAVVKTQIYPGVLELLKEWHSNDIKMGIVTNKPSRFTQPICEQLGISDFFTLKYSGDTFPSKKPDPHPLLKACEHTSTEITQTIMIGDSVNDHKAARAAGVTSVCVTYGYNHGENIADCNPDVLVDSLIELLSQK